jgi:hypothetical protein
MAEVVQATASSVITTLLNLVPLATRSVLPGTMCLSRVSRSGHLCAGCKGLGFVGAPLVFRQPSGGRATPAKHGCATDIDARIGH